MHQIAIAMIALCIAFVKANSTCHDCGPPKCGPNEVPVVGNSRRDVFCRPLYTPSLVFNQLRKCVCKPHFVRNSWGECVEKKSCRRCKSRLQKDWHTCSSSCPVTGNKPISLICRTMCTPGCDCPPGWVVDPTTWKNCVKATKYPPICPPNSRFESCVSTCEPVCGFQTPRLCFTHCHRGACVCNKGFVAFVQGGAIVCMLQETCLRYLRAAHVSVLNNTDFGARASAHGMANNGGSFMTAPGGMYPPGSSWRVFSNNVTHIIGTALPGDSRMDSSHSARNSAATSSGSGSGSGSISAGVNELPHFEAGSHAIASGFGGSRFASTSGETGTMLPLLGSLTAISPGMITAGVNRANMLTPDSTRTNAVHASLRAVGSQPGVGFVSGALSSGLRPAAAVILSAGRGHAAVTRHTGNTLTSVSAGLGGVHTGTGNAPTAVYSGRPDIMAGIGGTSARTGFSAESGGIHADLRPTGPHGGVPKEHGALSSGSHMAAGGGSSAGTVHNSLIGGLGNMPSHASAPSRSNNVGTEDAHIALSSTSTGFTSELRSAHKPISSESSGVSSRLRLAGTDGGANSMPRTGILGPGTSLASNSLLTATERMHTIRRSLAIQPGPVSRTPESIRTYTSALPTTSRIHESVGSEPAEASAIAVSLDAPRTHMSHIELASVDRGNSAATTRILAPNSGIGAMGTITGSVFTSFTGDGIMGNTNARSIFHGPSYESDVDGAGTESRGRSPRYSAEDGAVRVRQATTEIRPSSSVGSDMIRLNAGGVGAAGALPLAAPGLSRVGTSTVSAYAPSSVRDITSAPESSGMIYGVSVQPSVISGGVRTSGHLQPLSAENGRAGHRFDAASSPSEGLARHGTVNTENRQPALLITAGGANVMTDSGNGINVVGESPRVSEGFSNAVSSAVGFTTVTGGSDFSGRHKPLDLGDISESERALITISSEPAGSAILINGGSEGLNSERDNIRTSPITRHSATSGATVELHGAFSGSVTGAARENNATLTTLPSDTTFGSHSDIGSSHSGGIGSDGFSVPSGVAGTRDPGTFGRTDIATNGHFTDGSGASAPFWSGERSRTGTDIHAGDASRTGTRGEILPPAATSSFNSLGSPSPGVNKEGGFGVAQTTGSAHAGRASTNGIVRRGGGMVSIHEGGQYFPNSLRYSGSGYVYNPYLPGFMLNGAKDTVNTHLTVRPPDANILGGTQSDPIRYRVVRASTTSLPANVDISGIQPTGAGATLRRTTSP
ncbi:uncharacterized protein LOC142768859 isoform X1 [Rhipicephalus microplus]|uniref:uncharacterized protein LOC142768859 isoform X1 n=1 Tax=Rhipicephalus microplus TaxID=6941 RepID=UPI003F6AC9CD